jgi:hypothetical protein
MRRLSVVVAFFAAVISSPVHAKTFVGVLWPMFGPLPAIGLVELTAEIKMMPDVEVHTYLHQEWPDLVNDLAHQPEGTRSIIIGYSLGANATSWVVNKSKYVDLVIALQPSMLSWNPVITGKAGRIIEVYNPNVWMTMGGMGSKKLEWQGGNIEYIANNDSHPGAQFNLDFRNLVKTEIARMSTPDRTDVAQAESAKLNQLAAAEPPPAVKPLAFAEESPQKLAKGAPPPPADDPLAFAEQGSQKQGPQKLAKLDPQLKAPMPPKPQLVAREQTKRSPKDVAFLDTLSGSVNAGALPIKHKLTVADMTDYAKRAYVASSSVNSSGGGENDTSGDVLLAVATDPDRGALGGQCDCAFAKSDASADSDSSMFRQTSFAQQD